MNITMTLQEVLKAQNLTDEQVKGILDAMKQNKIYTASEENLDVRYGKLKTDHDAMVAKDAESQKLIADLQERSSESALQDKIRKYEATIQAQTNELQQFRMDSAMKIALISAGVKPESMEYLMYKLNNDSDWKPKLNDKGQIVGIDDKLKACKTINKDCFGHASSTIRVEERRIEHGKHIGMTKKEFDSMGYEQRLKLYNTDPELYNLFSNRNGMSSSQVRNE